MQQIDLYCKNCNKSFKIAHVISGDDSSFTKHSYQVSPLSREESSYSQEVDRR